MTTFFIPRLEHDRTAAESVYKDLRADAEAQSGQVAGDRRIQALLCRLAGRDRSIKVGADDAIDGQTVLAILQIGRDGYTIHCEDSSGDGRRSTIDIDRRTVYTVTEFDD